MADQNDDQPATGWFIGIILALAFLAIGYLIFAAQPARASSLLDIEKGTYTLYSEGEPICTAQAVDTGTKILVLTANHCIASKNIDYSIRTVTSNEKTGDKLFEDGYFLDVVKQDASSDIAVLAALYKGVDVLVAGFPNTNAAPIGQLVFTEGMFTGYSDSFAPGADGRFYRTTASVHYGNSGGGLYVEIDGDWKLIGITSQTDPERMWETSLFSTTENIDRAVRLIAPKPATDK